MELVEKIKSIYPELTYDDFDHVDLGGEGSISLMDLGNGPYIAVWDHPTLAQPTQEQLDAVTE